VGSIIFFFLKKKKFKGYNKKKVAPPQLAVVRPARVYHPIPPYGSLTVISFKKILKF
jgi:hypothetical protein